jgi:hypothetical protein
MEQKIGPLRLIYVTNRSWRRTVRIFEAHCGALGVKAYWGTPDVLQRRRTRIMLAKQPAPKPVGVDADAPIPYNLSTPSADAVADFRPSEKGFQPTPTPERFNPRSGHPDWPLVADSDGVIIKEMDCG